MDYVSFVTTIKPRIKINTMPEEFKLPTKKFDTWRFDSEEEADKAGEIFKIEWTDTSVRITDPDDNETNIALKEAPFQGLNPDDHRNFYQKLNALMELRAD